MDHPGGSKRFAGLRVLLFCEGLLNIGLRRSFLRSYGLGLRGA